MIKNGLYKITTQMLDGVAISNVQIIVLHDGKLHGGGPFFYTVGSYTCSNGKWKGEATTQEHTRYLGQHPWALKVVTLGFRGTYNDADAEIDAVALVGKQSVRFKSNLRLLVAG